MKCLMPGVHVLFVIFQNIRISMSQSESYFCMIVLSECFYGKEMFEYQKKLTSKWSANDKIA